MAKNIFKIIALFTVGAFGGIFANQILWPYFVERPLFYQYRLDQIPVYITEIKETSIQENVALVGAAEKAKKTLIGIRSQTQSGKNLEGSGLIITSDGLIVTLAELVPQGSDFSFFVDGKLLPFQILKRDLRENLALVKLSSSALNTAGFARLERLEMGERVFLVGIVFKNEIVSNSVNEGIVKTFDQNLIQTNIIESGFLAGSPVFNIQGEVLGISVIDTKGNVNVIPISKIREFVGI